MCVCFVCSLFCFCFVINFSSSKNLTSILGKKFAFSTQIFANFSYFSAPETQILQKIVPKTPLFADPHFLKTLAVYVNTCRPGNSLFLVHLLYASRALRKLELCVTKRTLSKICKLKEIILFLGKKFKIHDF